MSTASKCIAECFGTFCLVFAGTGAIVINDAHGGDITHVGIALTFGLIVMAMIYSIGELSGAHINPAVTVAFWVARRFKGTLLAPYIVAQCSGALLASLTLSALYWEHDTLGATLPAGPWHQAFIFEILLTMILMFVILRVSSGSKETGIMAGAAIGATVALSAMFAGPACGASMNPARSLGPAIVSLNVNHLWIYVVAPVIGACVAVVLDWLMKIPASEPSK